jgi:hypothetical protein
LRAAPETFKKGKAGRSITPATGFSLASLSFNLEGACNLQPNFERSQEKIMAILNYTTTIKASKTVGEIQEMLAEKGARRIEIEYDDNRLPDGVYFGLQVNQVPVLFRLPCNTEGVYNALVRERVPGKYQNRLHARNVAWRIIKDWIEAQLAIVEAGQAKMAEVFMPYAIDAEGRTMFQAFESHQKLLAEKN